MAQAYLSVTKQFYHVKTIAGILLLSQSIVCHTPSLFRYQDFFRIIHANNFLFYARAMRPNLPVKIFLTLNQPLSG